MVLSEIKNPFTAIKASFKLVKHNWWRSFGFLFISSVSAAVVVIYLLYCGMLFDSLLPSYYSVTNLIIAVIIMTVPAGFLINYYIITVWVTLYNDLTLRKQARL